MKHMTTLIRDTGPLTLRVLWNLPFMMTSTGTI